jgi:hypothetical protein
VKFSLSISEAREFAEHLTELISAAPSESTLEIMFHNDGRLVASGVLEPDLSPWSSDLMALRRDAHALFCAIQNLIRRGGIV